MRSPTVSPRSHEAAPNRLSEDRCCSTEQAVGALECRFERVFVSRLALREKQIQQNYRPVIGIHKWFARRPGSVFRSLLLAEFADGGLSDAYWEPHTLSGTIADPFMGGGTPLFEANRLGFDVVGGDVQSDGLLDRAPVAHARGP